MVSYWKGAGTIVHTRSAEGALKILVGKETKYLTDYLHNVRPMQAIKLPATLEEANTTFSQIARQLSQERIFHTVPRYNRITYDPPVIKRDEWRTNFRVLHRFPEPVMYGIPKGGKADADVSPLATACREFHEEIGIALDESRLKHLSTDRQYYFYGLEIDDEEVKQYEEEIRKRTAAHFGELQEIQFMPLNQVQANLMEFNGISRKVLMETFLNKNF